MITVKEINVKKAIRKSTFVDIFFVNLYSISPYSGCEHACVYCDGRAEKYFVEGDFEKNITARMNLPEILAKELPLIRERAPICIGSGITDVYQSIEEKYQITRRCGEVLAEHHLPVTILTKSSLIQRDLDIWSKVHRKNGFTLIMSITTLDEKVREICEPGASSVQERLETLIAFKEAGCSVGVFMMPLLPGISDGSESIRKLVERVRKIGVDFITPGFLTLRPGKQKEFYMEMLRENGASLISGYDYLYEKNLVSGSPQFNYRKKSMKECGDLINPLPTECPHKIFQNRMPIYLEIALLLLHMKELYKRRGIDVSSLRESIESYMKWAESEKSKFNRKRSLHADYIDEQLLFSLRCGGFEQIIPNEKLLKFICEVALERKVFNYITLTLE